MIDNNIIELKTSKFFKYDDHIYLFSSEYGSLFEVDERFYNIFKDGKSTYDIIQNFYGDEFQDFWTTIENSGLLKDNQQKDHPFESYKDKKINAIVLMLIQECNLRCTYCYGEDGQYNNRGVMSINVAKKAIDFLFEETNSNELSIMLFGGEPFMKFDLIKECVFYGYEKAKEYGKKLRFSTTTNGTLLTDEIIDFIKKYRISVTVSIDGDEKTHDANRFYASGKGAYKDTVENTSRLIKEYSAGARATITPANTKITDIFSHIKELGFNNVHASPCANMMDTKDYKELVCSYEDYIELFKDEIKKKNYKKATKMSNIYAILNRIHSGGKRDKFCGAINNMLAVDIEGNFYPCQRFVFDNNYMTGNIYDGYESNKEVILKDLIIDEESECNSCWIRAICGGGCPQENAVKNNSVKYPNSNFCNMMIELVKKLIFVYINLTEEEKVELFEAS